VNEHWEHDQPIFFVTVIPKEGLIATDVCGIDLGRVKQRLRIDLRGLSIVASSKSMCNHK
jgi:hypothetical protein